MPYFGSDAWRPTRCRRGISAADLSDGGQARQEHIDGNDSHAAHGEDAAEEEDGVHDSFQPLGRGAGQLESFHKTPEDPSQSYSFTGTSACGADEVGSVGAGSKVEERLSLSGEGDGVVGDEHEGALHLIAAVLDGLLAALHAADVTALTVSPTADREAYTRTRLPTG